VYAARAARAHCSLADRGRPPPGPSQRPRNPSSMTLLAVPDTIRSTGASSTWRGRLPGSLMEPTTSSPFQPSSCQPHRLLARGIVQHFARRVVVQSWLPSAYAHSWRASASVPNGHVSVCVSGLGAHPAASQLQLCDPPHATCVLSLLLCGRGIVCLSRLCCWSCGWGCVFCHSVLRGRRVLLTQADGPFISPQKAGF